MASDILAIEEILYAGLRSCALFDPFNVVMERKFLAQSEIEFNSLWQSPRLESDGSVAPGRRVGNGLYVEMPKLEVREPNSLQRNLLISIACIEERNLNMTPSGGGSYGGTQVSAEELAEMALDFMFGWVMGQSSALRPESAAVIPAKDLVQGDGLVTYRAQVSLRRERRPMKRCDTPTLTQGPPGTFTLTNGTNSPDADIYYMVAGDASDLRLPGKDNPDAVKHAGPFTLALGQVINWAAWRADLLPSHITVAEVS